jgi:hypothetical protein
MLVRLHFKVTVAPGKICLDASEADLAIALFHVVP